MTLFYCTDLTQHFMVWPVSKPLVEDCSESSVGLKDCMDPLQKGCSEFDPVNKVVLVEHYMSNLVAFVDKSSIAITGRVIFDHELVKGSTCPVAGATVHLTMSGEMSTIETDVTGRFGFAATIGSIIEISVTYGAHTFNPPKRTFLTGVTPKHYEFLDNTTELLNLALMDESKVHRYVTKSLNWEASSPIAMEGACDPPVVYRLVSG
jgi:hypothetical protein